MSIVARVTFVVLVGATFAAFFAAQRLKSAPPVLNVKLTRVFSPNGDGTRDVSPMSLTLKTSDEATVDVVNLDGDAVRRLVDSVGMKARSPLRMTWDGKDGHGARVPDGQYRVRVSLRDGGRSAIVQKTMLVDTKPPRSEV